jgi:hypothetical protein
MIASDLQSALMIKWELTVEVGDPEKNDRLDGDSARQIHIYMWSEGKQGHTNGPNGPFDGGKRGWSTDLLHLLLLLLLLPSFSVISLILPFSRLLVLILIFMLALVRVLILCFPLSFPIHLGSLFVCHLVCGDL